MVSAVQEISERYGSPEAIGLLCLTGREMVCSRWSCSSQCWFSCPSVTSQDAVFTGEEYIHK